jgi:hypothetical protein
MQSFPQQRSFGGETPAQTLAHGLVKISNLATLHISFMAGGSVKSVTLHISRYATIKILFGISVVQQNTSAHPIPSKLASI